MDRVEAAIVPFHPTTTHDPLESPEMRHRVLPSIHRSLRAGSVLLSIAAIALLGLACSRKAPLPGEGDDAGKTVVYRDTWGVPHIYAPTIARGLYAMGFAQAQDRPEQILRNFLLGIGEFSSVAGPGAVPSDLRSHLFDHYGAGKRGFEAMVEPMKSEVQAFTDGINAFYDQNPTDRPAWWGERRVDPAMVLAFGRLFLYNWSIDEAYEDLIRGGVQPVWERTARGSNQFAVSPARSAEGAAILAIDPHLAWDGPSRFWEVRVHAGAIHGSGVTLPGSPYIGLGHNRNVAWAMTTGGPDTADVYELDLRGEDDALQYLFDGEWRDLEQRQVELSVRGENGVEVQTQPLWFSHHGPVIARKGRKAYAARISYGDLVTVEAWRRFNLAETYEGVQEGLADSTLFPQNIMVADTSGNIYYQRTGRVPVRSADFDWSRPVNGSTSASEWQGIHPAADHLQVLNPSHGWMQNCNIPPDAMMPSSPFAENAFPDYLYAGPGHGETRGGWTNQRGARAVELLRADDSVTAAEAMAYINDVEPYGISRWIEALDMAVKAATAAATPDTEATARRQEALASILAWDRRLVADSRPALRFAAWREALEENSAEHQRIAKLIDSWYSIISGESEFPINLSAADQEFLVSAFDRGLANIIDDYEDLDATFGDRYRVGRDQDSWPLEGGGGRLGLTTLRNIAYAPERDDHMRRGVGGQTSTQVVVLSEPPKSWITIPWGQSDRPESPHYDDQAEKLFAERKLKESWWLPEQLADHVESRTVLER